MASTTLAIFNTHFGYSPRTSLGWWLITVPLSAQDEMKHVCDSTLVTLLLVAEHDYDYLSAKMDMGEEVPAIEYGQYGPVIDSIVAMMLTQAESSEPTMTEEEMAAHDQMLTDMMVMDTAGMVASYMTGMNMTMEESMTTLTSGSVADEDPVCAEVRADVEKFILAHILTEMSMMEGPM
jgi:hypothetical protein